MPKYQHTDYVDDTATEIDQHPHWSLQRASLGRMRAQTVRPELVAPIAPPARHALPPRLPPAVQVSCAPPQPRAPLPPPIRAPFYSFAEEQRGYHLDTERVAPLPMSSLRPTWMEALATAWSRFAAPACGAIAGLIFVVGYLAYSSQRGAAIAASAAPAPHVVMMPAAVAISAPAPAAIDEVEDATAEEAPAVEPTVEAPPAAKTIAAPKHAPAKRVVAGKKRIVASIGKRRPIRLNDSTPLGDLRPSRSR